MSKINDLHAEWMQDAEYRDAHASLALEFELARALIAARVEAGLTQDQVAHRMNTTQSAIARLESGKRFPSTKTLQSWARATGTRLQIRFTTEAQTSPARDAA
jgi:transcriptional regulator with XRE-family HTH domain